MYKRINIVVQQSSKSFIPLQIQNECLESQTTVLPVHYTVNTPKVTQEQNCNDGATAIGGVVGVLVTVLVVLVIGWSLSCVALVKRNLNTQKQTQ